MQQNLGNGAPGQGSEDTTEAVRHVQNAEENRDALEAQSRRTEATTDPAVREHPVREGVQASSGGLGGGTLGTEDASRAAAHAESAAENRDALEAQNRRTEATAPPEVREPIENENLDDR